MVEAAQHEIRRFLEDDTILPPSPSNGIPITARHFRGKMTSEGGEYGAHKVFIRRVRSVEIDRCTSSRSRCFSLGLAEVERQPLVVGDFAIGLVVGCCHRSSIHILTPPYPWSGPTIAVLTFRFVRNQPFRHRVATGLGLTCMFRVMPFVQRR